MSGALEPETQPRERWVLLSVLLLAMLVRLIDIQFHPESPDDQYSVDLARMSWPELVETTAADTHPPLYYGMLKLWYAATPETMASAQVLSVIFSILTLALLFGFTRERFGRVAAWAALLTASFAPYQIYWHHSPRNHQLLPLGVLAVLWLSDRFLKTPSRREWFALAAAWVLTVQANYMGLVVGLVWGLAFLFARREPWRRRGCLALAPLPALLSFVPWVWIMARQMESGPAVHQFFQEQVSPMLLYFHSVFGTMSRYAQPHASFVFVLELAVFTVVVLAGAKRVGRTAWFWVLLIGLPTVPVLLARHLGWTLANRHLAFCLPLFMAYWGAGCAEIWERMRGRFFIKQ